LSRPPLTQGGGRGKAETRFRERRKARTVTAATTNERPLARALTGASASGKKTPRPTTHPRPRTRRGRAQGAAGARSTAATTEPRAIKPPRASASLWRPGARKMGRRRGPRPGFALKRAQGSDEAQTGQGREAGRRRTRPAGGRAAHGRRQANATCALQREAWPWAMTAPHPPRGACGHGGGLHQQTAKTDKPRDGRGGRVRERDLCTRSLIDNGPQSGPLLARRV